MVMSRATSPHVITVVQVDYEAVERARKPLRAQFKEQEGFSLTYLAFIGRAVVDALSEFPHMNASVDGANLVIHHEVHLAIAVDLDFKGLLAPVVRDAHDKRLRAIARDINDLAVRARSKQLGPDELGGGTFTLSNSGQLRHVHRGPDHQPATGGDPVDRRREPAAGRRDRRARQRVDRRALGREPDPGMGPPGVRRCVRRSVHGAGQGDPRDPRLDRGALSSGVTATWAPGIPGDGIAPHDTLNGTPTGTGRGLRVRWLGTVAYREAWALQRGLHRGPAGDGSADDHLLLVEHPHVYTLGRNADRSHVLVDPESVGADCLDVDRGGRRHLPRPRPARRLPAAAPAGEGRRGRSPTPMAT